jgi:hypothetical protein
MSKETPQWAKEITETGAIGTRWKRREAISFSNHLAKNRNIASDERFG